MVDNFSSIIIKWLANTLNSSFHRKMVISEGDSTGCYLAEISISPHTLKCQKILNIFLLLGINMPSFLAEGSVPIFLKNQSLNFP